MIATVTETPTAIWLGLFFAGMFVAYCAGYSRRASHTPRNRHRWPL